MSIGDRKILVTGGGSGIGLALARGFLENGSAVAFTYRSDDALERPEVREVMGQYPSSVAIRADFSSGGATGLVGRAAAALGGDIDVLVNNAASFSRSEFMEATESDFKEILSVNTLVPFALIKEFSSALIAKSLPGSIINISSLSSTMARSKMTAYQCSKAAMDMLSNSAAYELAKHQIRSNIIAPGLTETSANQTQRESQPELWEQRSARLPSRRAGMPDDFVSAAIFLADDGASWITGARIVIDGGLSAF